MSKPPNGCFKLNTDGPVNLVSTKVFVGVFSEITGGFTRLNIEEVLGSIQPWFLNYGDCHIPKIGLGEIRLINREWSRPDFFK